MSLKSIGPIFEIKEALYFKIPKPIVHAHSLFTGDAFACHVGNLYVFGGHQKPSHSKSILHPCYEIDGDFGFRVGYANNEHVIQLSQTPLAQEFGLLVGQYMGIVFNEIVREEASGFLGLGISERRIPLFPARTLEDLSYSDFIVEDRKS